jgi:peptidyl-prolyl cis-trans isomerase D
MLQILRNKAQSIVIQAIVVIIALVFIFWGVGANLMNNREAALVINDEEISFEEFQVAYDRSITNLGNQFGGTVPQGLLESLGIKDQVINQLIQQALLRQGAKKMGLLISREEIQDTIKSMVQFEENGAFSLEKYQSLLALNNYSPSKFEETVKLDMLVQRTSLDISKFAATANDFEIEELHRMEKSTVAVKYVKISPNDYLESITPTDEDLEKWYATVQDNYKTDPEIKLQYLDFSYDTVGEKITIDEATIEKYYEDNTADYTTPEQRSARHILFKADDNSPAEVHTKQEERAQEILELAKNGSEFADLAKQYSEGPTKERGGDLGLFSKGQMVKPFDEAVFSLKSGEISEVVKTSFGYHIIKLEKIVPATTKPLEEVKVSIMKKLQGEQAKPLAFQVANESYEAIIGAGSLKAYLDANPDRKTITTDFFSRNNPPASLANDPKFLTTAFALKEGELSSLIETANGYAILFAEAINQPSVPALADVKSQVSEDYIQSKTEEMAKETATALLKKAKEGFTLGNAAEEQGLTVEDSGYLSKNSGANEESSFPVAMVDDIFKLSGKEPLPAEPRLQDGDFYVFEFIGQKLPEETMTEEDKERYKKAIIQLKQQQLLAAWLDGERQEAKIMTHKSL